MEKKIFKLINNETNLRDLEFEVKEQDTHYIDGILRNVALEGDDYPDENLFIANFYIRWDGCSDIRFRGMRYENATENPDGKIDGYYHMCGGSLDYLKIMRGMAFASEIAIMEIPNLDLELSDFEKVRKLNLLENYRIEL